MDNVATRVGVFIDGSWVKATLREQCLTIDFTFFMEELKGEVQKLVYVTTGAVNVPDVSVSYFSSSNGDEEESMLHEFLKSYLHYVMEIYPRIRSDREPSHYMEKGVDVALASRMVLGAATNSYDIAVLVSGDGDFLPAIKIVKELGKKILLVVARGCISLASTSKTLAQEAESFGFKVLCLNDFLCVKKGVNAAKPEDPKVVEDPDVAEVITRIIALRDGNRFLAYKKLNDVWIPGRKAAIDKAISAGALILKKLENPRKRGVPPTSVVELNQQHPIVKGLMLKK